MFRPRVRIFRRLAADDVVDRGWPFRRRGREAISTHQWVSRRKLDQSVHGRSFCQSARRNDGPEWRCPRDIPRTPGYDIRREAVCAPGQIQHQATLSGEPRASAGAAAPIRRPGRSWPRSEHCPATPGATATSLEPPLTVSSPTIWPDGAGALGGWERSRSRGARATDDDPDAHQKTPIGETKCNQTLTK